MPVDFSAAAKAARAAIPVPALNLHAVRERSKSAAIAERARRILLAAAVSVGVLGSAAALAANLDRGIHVWMFGNTIEASVTSFAQVRSPMAADVERIVKSAAFTVTLPAGVPKNDRILWIAYSPADHPTFVQILFANPSGALPLSAAVLETSSIERNRALLAQAAGPHTTSRAEHFTVGPETVLLGAPALTAAQKARVQHAMQSDTPARAQADLDAHLTRLLVLAPVASIPIELAAERVAPRSGKNVLLGRWALHELPARTAHGEPLRDPRPIVFTNIPSVNGQPDYRNATVQFARPIAVSAAGARSIEAMLRRAGIAPDCACQVLVHRTGPAAYEGWRIDAKTLKATRI